MHNIVSWFPFVALMPPPTNQWESTGLLFHNDSVDEINNTYTKLLIRLPPIRRTFHSEKHLNPIAVLWQFV